MKLPDQTIWNSLKNGNKEAYLQIYKSHYELLYSYGLKLSNDQELTRDCIHEIFVNLWEQRAKLNDVLHIKAYLLKYLRRLIFHKLKKKNRQTSIDSLQQESFQITFSPEDLLIQQDITKENQQKIMEALSHLSPRQKEIIYLKFYDELSYQEIQDIMSLSYQSVRNTLHKALTSLRKRLLSLVVIIFFTSKILYINSL
ncbi:sigma-70 family RNA polymerase sigma factor [Rapidithrix thailandica]|uniref:Sigma-70 family RNA polymerase sigma factor n=1 Tax=Rapidithrix thailandica TaxID=413964 RepID=A0AAW9SA03_9BACT